MIFLNPGTVNAAIVTLYSGKNEFLPAWRALAESASIDTRRLPSNRKMLNTAVTGVMARLVSSGL